MRPMFGHGSGSQHLWQATSGGRNPLDVSLGRTTESRQAKSRAAYRLHMSKRWKEWPQGLRWLIAGAITVVLVLVVAWALFIPAADWLARHDVGSVTGPLRTLRLQTARDAARGRLLTLSAGLLALGALIFTALNFNLLRRNSEQADQWQRRTLELTEQGQVTDRYTKAIEQLGSDRGMDVRIGGIYALERIASDSARDHPTVIEVLSAFVREHSCEQWPPPPTADQSDAGTPQRRTRPDMQAAVTVIGRRDSRYDRQPVNLADACLTRVDLTEASLVHANLFRADLTGASLFRVNLAEAGLVRANLTEANLGSTNLKDAHLIEANLGHAILSDVDLAGADLTGAILAGAFLSDVYLTGANLNSAQLDGVNLSGAVLTGADLTRADLRYVHFTGANLTGANLTAADLTRADLTRADLPMALLREADLTEASLYFARLPGANLSSAKLPHANLTTAKLPRADLTGADLTGAMLAGATLNGADLTDADLSGADLTRSTDFTGAKLDRAIWPRNAVVPEGWERDTDSGRLRRFHTDSDEGN